MINIFNWVDGDILIPNLFPPQRAAAGHCHDQYHIHPDSDFIETRHWIHADLDSSDGDLNLSDNLLISPVKARQEMQEFFF